MWGCNAVRLFLLPLDSNWHAFVKAVPPKLPPLATQPSYPLPPYLCYVPLLLLLPPLMSATPGSRHTEST